MGLFFRKKKKAETVKEVVKEDNLNNYTETEKEFQFLNNIIERKINISKAFYIDIDQMQLEEKDFIRDKDLEEIIKKDVKEVLSSLAANYKNFLIKKYFNTKENLVKYVSEEFYVKLSAYAIESNYRKQKKNAQKEIIRNMTKKEGK